MPSFAYSARDHAGSAVSGILVANSAVEVTQMLRADGKYPTAIRPADASEGKNKSFSRGQRMSRKDLIQISQQLAIMIETGVTLTEALDSIATQAEKPNIKSIVGDLSQQVQGGSDLSSALQRHPRAFPRLYIALIAASEKSGMMSKLLHRATDYLRDEHETIRRVKGALTYPGIMLLFAITTTGFLLAFVLPRFTAIYVAKGAALPLPTKILMGLSDFLIGQWMILLIAVASISLGIYLSLRTDRGKRIFHFIQLHAPLFGPIFRKLHLSRGLRMIGTMSGSGVNLVDCVQTAHDLCGNAYFRDLWSEVSHQIQQGKQLSEPMYQNKLVPRSVSQMLHSAEKGGKLSQVMEQVAHYAEQELKEKITEMTRYIEPLMIVVMGAIIGSVALALMLPIFSISKVIAK